MWFFVRPVNSGMFVVSFFVFCFFLFLNKKGKKKKTKETEERKKTPNNNNNNHVHGCLFYDEKEQWKRQISGEYCLE